MFTTKLPMRDRVLVGVLAALMTLFIMSRVTGSFEYGWLKLPVDVTQAQMAKFGWAHHVDLSRP